LFVTNTAILAFAGLEPDVETILRRRPTERKATGSLNADSGVSDENVDAWRSRLSRREIGIVEAVTHVHLRRFGYQPTLPVTLARGYLTAHHARRWAAHLWRRLLRSGT
jgi:hypothetical protein